MREPTDEEAGNAQLTENLLEAENERDYERLFSVVSDDVVLHRPVFAVGRPALRRIVEMGFSAFPDHHRVPIDIHPVGPFVVVKWQFTGTHLGEWAAIAPTGRKIDVKGASLIEFSSLRLIGVWCYADNDAIARQLGTIDLDAESRMPALALS